MGIVDLGKEAIKDIGSTDGFLEDLNDATYRDWNGLYVCGEINKVRWSENALLEGSVLGLVHSGGGSWDRGLGMFV